MNSRQSKNKQIHNSWPQKGDAPFLEPSVRNAVHLLVLPSESAYISGYKDAGDQLTESFLTGSDRFDHVVFPIAFLYRHHIELLLKQLVRAGIQSGLIREPSRPRGEPCASCGHVQRTRDWRSEHDLRELWSLARQVIVAFCPQSPSEDLLAVERVIQEFHRLDAKGQSFRYSTSLNGRTHLQNVPRALDLCELRRVVDGVSCFLEAAVTGIEESDPGAS